MIFAQESAAAPFAAWESFYVIVGSAGGALTGLQFVAIALISDLGKRRTPTQIDAFATPTIVHFCAVLIVSSLLSAPWHALTSAAIPVSISGGVGIGYTLIVLRRVTAQDGYTLVFEDWLFHTALPLLAYAALLAAGLTLASHTVDAEFGVASAMLLLLIVGIHNAWDSVTYIATEPAQARGKEESGGPEETG